jgi:hypothetical protein
LRQCDEIFPLAGVRRTRRIAAIRSPGRWGITVALLMLPYFSFGLMEVIADPIGRDRAVFFTLLTVGTFLASLDAARYGR